MTLLELQDYRAVPSGEALGVKIFRDILDRDPTDEREIACGELAFVWFVADWESPFVRSIADEDDLYEAAKDQVFGDHEWEPDDVVHDAIAAYRKLGSHPIVQVLMAAYQTLARYRDFLEKVDFNEKDQGNKAVWDVKKVMDTLNNLGKTVESLTKIEEQVKQTLGGNAIRGGFEPNQWSD